METILCSFLYCEKRRRKINSFLYLVLGLFESLIASSVFTWAKLGSWISTIITVMDYVKEIRMRSSNKSLDSQLNVGHKCTIVHWSWHHQSSFHTCIMELPHQWWPREPHHQFLATPGDENQQALLKDPLHVPVGPTTRARSKKIKEALNGLIQDIWADSTAGHSKLGPKEDEGVINLIQAADGADHA